MAQLQRDHNNGVIVLKPWGGEEEQPSQFDNNGWQNYDHHWEAAAAPAYQEVAFGEELPLPSAGPINFVISVWEKLKSHNAVCTLASQPSIYSFAEQCIFFATIEFLPSASKPIPPSRLAQSKNQNSIGCIYLSSTHRTSEASIGIVLLPQHTRKGYGPLAIEMVLELAFDLYRFHRVCAIIPEHPDNRIAIQVFQRFGFIHEGTHRLAATSENGTWVDEHHYAMIDTDWIFKRSPVKIGVMSAEKEWKLSPWEQLLARQEKEREAMLLRDHKLNRTSSTETLRLAKQDNILQDFQDYAEEDDENMEDDEMSNYSSDGESFVSASAEVKGKENPFATKECEGPADPFASSSSLARSTEDEYAHPSDAVSHTGETQKPETVVVKMEEDSDMNDLGTHPPRLSSPTFQGRDSLSLLAEVAASSFNTSPKAASKPVTSPEAAVDQPSPSKDSTGSSPRDSQGSPSAINRNSPRWAETRSPPPDDVDAASEAGSQNSLWDLVDEVFSVRSASVHSTSESLVSVSENEFTDLSDDEDLFAHP